MPQPHQIYSWYMKKYKMNIAANELKNTDRKINEIVYICGAVKITNPTWDKAITQLPYEFSAEVDTICRTTNANNKLSICAMSAAGRLAFLETAVDTTNTDTAPIVFINMAVPVK